MCYNKYGDVMKIGDKVSVPMYIGLTQHKLVHKEAIIVKAYPKGHLGTMYLCKTIPSGFRTCIVVPPPPRFQPDAAYDRNLPRWSKATHHNALEVEPQPSATTTSYQKRTHEQSRSIIDKYTPMLKELGLDPAVKRSITKLRSIAQFRGYDIDEIENRN